MSIERPKIIADFEKFSSKLGEHKERYFVEVGELARLDDSQIYDSYRVEKVVKHINRELPIELAEEGESLARRLIKKRQSDFEILNNGDILDSEHRYIALVLRDYFQLSK